MSMDANKSGISASCRVLIAEILLHLPDSAWAGGNLAEWAQWRKTLILRNQNSRLRAANA